MNLKEPTNFRPMRFFYLVLTKITLMLLIILSWQPVFAAAPEIATPKMAYTFELTAHLDRRREGAPVCVGEEVTIIVRAWRQGYDPDLNRTIPRNWAFNVPVEVNNPNPDLMALTSPAMRRTSMDLELTGAAEFKFKTKKAGTAVLFFESMFPERQIDEQTRSQMAAAELRETLYASARTSVNIVECVPELSVTTIWNSPPMYQFIATFQRAVLQPDALVEGRFVYEGLEDITLTYNIPGCDITWEKAQRLVNIEAIRDGDVFHVTIQRASVTLQVTFTCPGFTETKYLDIPSAGTQKWDVSVRGDVLTYYQYVSPASVMWVLEAKARK